MKTFADKTQENQSKTASHGSSEKRSNSEPLFQFVDNRPEAVAQGALQEMANNSPQAKRLMAYQEMANNGSQSRNEPQKQTKAASHAVAIIQRTEILKEEPLPERFEPVQEKENKTGMPDRLKAGVEQLSGMDLSDVRVHYNSAKPARLQALAYTQGRNIHVGPGQERHLPHEAWHAVQQEQGRVQPTMQMKGMAINDDPRLEREADVMGGKTTRAATVIGSGRSSTRMLEERAVLQATATSRAAPLTGSEKGRLEFLSANRPVSCLQEARSLGAAVVSNPVVQRTLETGGVATDVVTLLGDAQATEGFGIWGRFADLTGFEGIAPVIDITYAPGVVTVTIDGVAANGSPFVTIVEAIDALQQEVFVSMAADVAANRYTMVATAITSIRRNTGEAPFVDTYSGGKSVAEAVEEAIDGLDLTGSNPAPHARHDFQDSTHGENLQVQLGGSSGDYRRGGGDTSSTLVVVEDDLWTAMMAGDRARWKKIIQAAHRQSFANRQRVDLGLPPAPT